MDNISGGDSDQETSDITNIKLPLEVANSQIAEKDKEIEQLCNKLKKLEEQSKKVILIFFLKFISHVIYFGVRNLKFQIIVLWSCITYSTFI